MGAHVSTSLNQTQAPSGGGSGDKYGVFDELRSAGSGLLSQSQPQTAATISLVTTSNTAPPDGGKASTGDKYSVFDNLHPVSVSEAKSTNTVQSDDFGTFSAAPLSSSSSSAPSATSQQGNGGILAFSSAPSTSVPPVPGRGGDGGVGGGGFADFASFQSSASTGEIVSSQADTANDGWAAFTDFTSSESTAAKQDAQFPASTLPTTSSNSSTAKSLIADSAFDALLPPELLLSKTSKAAAKSVKPVKPVEPALLDSLESKVTVTTVSAPATTTAAAALDFAMFESDQPSSSESKELKEEKKQLTGLEILEEEFSARVSAKVASSMTASVGILEPLVPESAPLDEFGEFEAYSSPGKEEKKTGLPPGGESPSTLKKVGSGLIQCLVVVIYTQCHKCSVKGWD